ncbi:helix-turn-helix domain-containing protein [Streptomyces sp. NPDC059378]|uniref:helix-turn-helix domain-containing protein n=1 Tax=Streptomyces sp. NPDC059378 TaxID=3346815 RepID=UPI0036CA8AB1
MSDRAPRRLGRPAGPLSNAPDSKPAVAAFLRKLQREAGVTQADLATQLEVSTSTLSTRLRGERLDWPFVKKMIELFSKGDALTKERRLGQAELLWNGLPPKAQVTPTRQPNGRDIVIDSLLRASAAEIGRVEALQELSDKQRQLDQAIRARGRAEAAVQAASSLNAVLATWVRVMADEVDHAQSHRSALARNTPVDRTELMRVDTLLSLAVRHHERITRDSAIASTDLGRATAILAGLITCGRRLQADIARLHADKPSPDDIREGGTDHALPLPFDAAREFAADIDRALDRIEAFSNTIGQEVQQTADALAALDPAGADRFPQQAAPTARSTGYRPGSFLALLTPEDHDNLVQLGDPRRTQDIVLFSLMDGVVLVRSGLLVRKIRTRTGAFNVGVCGAGDIAGDTHALTGLPTNQVVEYLRNGTVVVIPSRTFAEHLRAAPAVRQALLASEAHDSARSSRQAGRGPRQALIRLLVRLAESYGEAIGEGIGITLDTQTLSSIVPDADTTLSELAREDLAHVRERHIVVPDLDALRASQQPPAPAARPTLQPDSDSDEDATAPRSSTPDP